MAVWAKKELAGWGRARRATGEAARPERAAGLAEAVAETESLCLRGAGRAYGDAAISSEGRTLLTGRLDRVLDFDTETGVVRAEAGISIRRLIDLFVPQGWAPPVAPGTGFATLGGCIAADVHGKNHESAGSFGMHLGRIEMLTGAGPLTLDDPADPRIRATVGGMGLTGAIAAAELRLTRVASAGVELSERRIGSLAEFLEAFEETGATYSVGWIDALASGAELGRGVFEEAEIAAEFRPRNDRGGRAVPFEAPRFALSGPVVRAFNSLYWRRIPDSGRSRKAALTRFLFPLDAIHDWNKLYGKGGFHQFQCVVPADARDALRDMLEIVAESGRASPLAVLKKLGPGRAGMLSFPMAGWTLAVDIPARRGVEELFARLEDAALSAGGRIYLAKDALARPESMKRMYPELDAFRRVAKEMDPDSRFASDLSRRLGIRP